MTKTATMQARMDPQTKKRAEIMLKKFGLRSSDFINMAVNQMLLEKRIPFSSRIPNQETIDAMKESPKNRISFASAEQAMDALWPADAQLN